MNADARRPLVPYEDDDIPWYRKVWNCLPKCKRPDILQQCFVHPMRNILSGSILPYLSWSVILVTIFLILTITKGVHEVQNQRGKDNSSLLSVNLKIVLVFLMFLSISGIIYCILKRKNQQFVRYKKFTSKSIPIRYLLVGLYVFGTGTLFLNILWLLFFIHGFHSHKSNTIINEIDINVIDIIYSCFRFVFVVLQIAFLQSFWSATFNKRWEVKLLLFHTMSVNMCTWLMNVVDETDIFESDMKRIGPRNSTTDSFDGLMKKYNTSLTPFTLEYSLIVAGILYGIINEIKDFSIHNGDIDENHLINDEDSYDDETETYISLNEDKGRNGGRQGSQPGMLIGIICGAVLLVSEMAIGFTEIEEYQTYLYIFYISNFMIFIFTIFSSWRIMKALPVFEKINDANTRPDDILLVFSLIWGIAFDAIVVIGTCKCKIVSSHLFGLMLSVEILQFLQRVFQTWILVLSHKYDPNVEEEESKIKARIIRQNCLFLLFSNLGMWALDTFFEMRNSGAVSYPCGQKAFGKDMWNKLTAFTYPVIIFYRFHAAAMSFDLWAHFRFHKKK